MGLDYGINNKTGKPTREMALSILDRALAQDIKIFDTAHAYGDAEEILGEFISSRNLYDKVSIISKFKPELNQDYIKDMGQAVETEIRKSLGKLKISCLDGYLLHDPKHIYNKEIVGSLQACQRKGLVKNIGVSIYNEEDAIYAVRSGKINYIQIPYSVFDQRLNKTDFFNIAKDNQVTVFARSIFLQGLVFMRDEEIPASLAEIKRYLAEFDAIINRYNLTRLQAALLFVYGNNYINYIVFGADNIKQIDNNIKIIKESVNYEECMSELKNRFGNINQNFISPNAWK